MDEPTFWRLVEEARVESEGDVDAQAGRLQTMLAELPADEIMAFDDLLWQMMDRAYRHELWAAAYVINGGCSDDCFDYFCGWLIAQGERVFYDTLRDPEGTLVAVVEEGDIEGEAMLGAADHAYLTKGGQEMPRRLRPVRELTGEPWEEETVHERYPRLAAKFWPQV
jgi:hypothetical protein